MMDRRFITDADTVISIRLLLLKARDIIDNIYALIDDLDFNNDTVGYVFSELHDMVEEIDEMILKAMELGEYITKKQEDRIERVLRGNDEKQTNDGAPSTS